MQAIMDKIRYRLVYNRRKTLNKQGTALVQVEASLNQRKVYFTTRVYLQPQYWDATKAQIIHHPQAEELNVMLFEFMVKLQGIELRFWKQGTPATLALLKEAVEKKGEANVTFMQFAEQAIEYSDKRSSTKENQRTTLAVLKEFRSGLDFKDLSYAFLKEFEQHLRERGNGVNTIAKHLRHLRMMINEAIRSGHMSRDDYPFREYRIKQVQAKHIYLTPDELKRLEGLKLENKRKQHVLDAFLFCCYSGLRFSDFRNLQDHHLTRMQQQHWLSLRMQKTNVEIKLPLHLLFEGKALALLSKYKNVEAFAQIGRNVDVNRSLKDIATEAKIDKKFTYHSARHTNAVHLIHQGVPITTVQRLLGHTDISTTQVYVEVMADTVVKDLKNACKKIRRL